jgi:tRNA G18 (ribose-2'-O)-methylase SpoU
MKDFVQFVDAFDDPRVALYRSVRDPALLRDHGLFVAEGRLVVRRLLETPRFRTRSLLVTPQAAEELSDIVKTLDERTPVYVGDSGLFNELTGFDVHRGCLAIGERPPPVPWSQVASNPRTLIVLERVGNPDNVGGVFRAAAALGGEAVLLSPGCADPLYRKSIRTSMAATLAVPFATAEPWPDALGTLRADGVEIVALTPSGSEEIGEVRRARRIALLFGHEGLGLTAGALVHADRRVRIEMSPGTDSLNIVTAAAIAMHRLSAAM